VGATASERRGHRLPWHAFGLILAACVLAAAVVWVGVRALLVKDDVAAIQSLTTRMTDAAASADLDALGAVNAELGTHARRAVGLTADPLWRTAELLPVVGTNLAAVRTAVDAVDTLSTRVVSPVLGVTTSLADLSDTAGLRSALSRTGPLADAARALHDVDMRLAAIPTGDLVAPVASGVEQLTDVVHSADAILEPLAAAAPALPELLGTDGPKTLLVMIQNNAELRTGGGITGTFVQLRAENGKVILQRMRDSGAFRYRTTPIAPIPDGLSALYGDVVGRFVQDASIPADFSLTARLASAWWTSHGGAEPDAVISIDPIVLQSLLDESGPVRLADGSELSAGNLVQRVLVEPYRTMTSAQQSVFFGRATAAVFERLFTGGLTPVQWAHALTAPIQDGRISAWSADAQTQSALEASPLGGPLVRQSLAGDAAYAVYFNDNTGGKMAEYMKTAISTADGVCRTDGKRTVQVSVTLTSTAPADVSTLPISVTGGGLWGVGAGDIGMNVTVAAPRGAFFDGVGVDGRLTSSVNTEAEGHPSSILHVNLQPGETNVLRFRFVVDHDRPVTVVHTPMLTDPDLSATTLRCD
jgi:hypothetical protein